MHEWAREMFGRSGQTDMGSVMPLSEPTLDAWSRRTGHRPTELEVQALFALDAVMRSPRETVSD